MATDFSNIFGRQPSYLDGLLSDEEINNLQKQANTQAIFNIAAGLLEAGSPSREPTSLGQGIARGFFGGQQAYQDAYKNALQGLMMEEKLRPLKTRRDVEAKLKKMPTEKPDLFIDKVADGGGVVNYSQLFDVPLRDGKASTQGMGTGLSGGQQFGLNMDNVNDPRLGLLETDVGKYAPSYSPTTSDTMFGTAEQVPAPSVFLPSQKGVEIGTLDPNTGESTLRELPEVMIDPETGVAKTRTPLDMFNVSDRATSPQFSDTRLARQALEPTSSSLPLQDAVMQTTTTMSELDKIRALKADPNTTADEMAYLNTLEKSYLPDVEYQALGNQLVKINKQDGTVTAVFGNPRRGTSLTDFQKWQMDSLGYTPDQVHSDSPNYVYRNSDGKKLRQEHYEQFTNQKEIPKTEIFKANNQILKPALEKITELQKTFAVISKPDSLKIILSAPQTNQDVEEWKQWGKLAMKAVGSELSEEEIKRLDSLNDFEQIRSDIQVKLVAAMGGARGFTEDEQRMLRDTLFSVKQSPEARFRLIQEMMRNNRRQIKMYEQKQNIARQGKPITAEIDINEYGQIPITDQELGLPDFQFDGFGQLIIEENVNG